MPRKYSLLRATTTLASIISASVVYAQDCQYYSDPAITALQSQFPPSGQIAQIVANDNVARSLYNSILASNNPVFNIAPSQVVNGAVIGNGYNAGQDPNCWWTMAGCVTPKHAGLPNDIAHCTEPSTWGLTFDDGPNCAHNTLYDFLKANSLRATLFYIGTNVYNWPHETQRGVADGHQVAVHTWSHHYMTSLTNEQVFAELYYTKKIIKDFTGVTPRFWRPPMGDVDDRVRAWAQALDLWTTLWDNDTFDWQISITGKQAVDNNYAGIIAKANNQGGTLVLTHEISTDTMNEFMGQYQAIKRAYQHVVPALTCYNITAPYAEQNVTFPNYAAFIAGQVNATFQQPFISNSPIVIANSNFTAPANVTSSSSSSALPSSTISSSSAPTSSSASRTQSISTGAIITPSAAGAASSQRSAGIRDFGVSAFLVGFTMSLATFVVLA